MTLAGLWTPGTLEKMVEGTSWAAEEGQTGEVTRTRLAGPEVEAQIFPRH